MIFLEEKKRTTRNFDLNEATSQIISMTFKINSFKLQNFTIENPTIYFLKVNLLNDYYTFLRKSSNYYVVQLSDSLESNHFKFLIFLMCSIGAMIGVFIMLIPIYNLVLKSQRESVKIFLEIPLDKVKMLFDKCENFLNHLQVLKFVVFIFSEMIKGWGRKWFQ